MKPLVYLFVRSLVNGVKRAISSPRRLIGVLFFFGYYWLIFIRPLGNPSRNKSRTSESFDAIKGMGFPEIPIIEGVVFTIFMVFGILLMLTLTSYKVSFKQADIDTMFPTPVNPKIVMGFRLVRDYFLTLIFPLFIAVVSFRPLAELFSSLMTKDPAKAQMLYVMGSLAWVLTALAWVCLGYAMSLFVGRSDETSEKRGKIISWAIGLLVLSTWVYGFVVMKANPSGETFLALTKSPFLRIVYFIPTAATATVMAPISGQTLWGVVGLGSLVALTVGGLYLSFAQSDWLYDQASTKGGGLTNLKEMQRKGDFSGMQAEMARQGKIKRGRLATWASRLTFRRGWALVYKEVLLFLRTQIVGTLILVVTLGFVSVAFLFIESEKSRPIIGALYLGMGGFMLMMMSLGIAQTGFLETLKRVDLIKPLAFRPVVFVFSEVVGKSLVMSVASVMPYLIGLCIKPTWWDLHLSGMIIAPSLVIMIASLGFLISVLFPDFEDPTQRGFRGLIMMLAIAIAALPTFGLMAVSFGMNLMKLPLAILCVPINLGITLLVGSIAANFYADFNPTE